MINTNNVMSMVTVPPEEAQQNDVSNNTINIPLVGRVHFVQDREGWMYVSGVLAYWIYGTFTIYYIILRPGWDDGVIPSIVVYGYLAICALCLLALIKASSTNPGRVPNIDASQITEKGWVLCTKCNRMRPPRSHHCRRCGQCVLRMDHHCPWINNCVGEDNHFAFMQLLFYAFMLGGSAFVLIMCHFWVFPKCVTCDQEVFYIKHSIWFMYLAFGLSLNMAVIMGIQFGQQHVNLLINRTTLENMVSTPQWSDLQVRKTYNAYRELCGQGHCLLWWWPLGRRRPCRPLVPVQNIV